MAGSLALAVGVAFPWYFRNREAIFGYLFSYGYGERAARFGSGNVLDRTGFRIGRIIEAFAGTNVLGLSLLVAAGVLMWRWRRSRLDLEHVRENLAIAAAFIVGMAALISTTNNGVWFELPLVVLATPLLVAALSVLPRWLIAIDVAVITVVSTALLSMSWWLVPYQEARPTSHYEQGFEQYDTRFAPERRDEHRDAAADWWRSIQKVEREMRRLAPRNGDAVFTVTGNMQLFNTNSLSLAGELDGWPPTVWVPDTAAGADERAEQLTPTTGGFGGRGTERILVIAVHDQILFTPDTEVALFAAEARELGWKVVSTIGLPDGGEVQILRHPDGS